MNPLVSFLVVFAASCLFIVIEADHAEKHHDYGKKQQEALCAKDDDALYNALIECFRMEHQIVQDAAAECSETSHPETKGDYLAFFKEACKDKSLFEKHNECYEKYENDENFKKEAEMEKEVIECYNSAFRKFGLEDHILSSEEED